GFLDRSAPELEAEPLELAQQGRRIADEPELGESDELVRRKGAGAAVLLEAVVRDQLDDVAGRVVEIQGTRVPPVEVEGVPEELDPLACPGERSVEPVARDEHREVVEGPAVLDAETKPRLADHDRVTLDRQPELYAVELPQVERRREGHLSEPHRPEHTITPWTRPGAPSWRS